MDKRRRWAVGCNVLLLAALLVFIFGNSLQPRAQSSEQSMGVLAALTAVLERLFGYGGLTEHAVRKLAHFPSSPRSAFSHKTCGACAGG